MFNFSLVDEKWIPCLVKHDGLRQELSLKDTLLRASEIKGIFDPSPLVTIAVHRLLLAILHRNFGPANESEWEKLWNNGTGKWDAGNIMTYLNKWYYRFNLFDEKYPFYQCRNMPVSTTDAKGKPKSYAKSIANLIHELVTGNNATLFDHTSENKPPAVSPAEAARLLVAFQAFSVSGLLTYEAGQNPKFYKSADNAPLVKGAVTLAQGENLFQTLMLNLHKYNSNEAVPFDIKPDDCPAWECEDETIPGNRYPKGYLDLLTWQSRRIRLIPEQDNTNQTVIRQVVIMKGNQFPDGYSLHNKETMLAYRKIPKPSKDQDPWPAVAFQEDKALWRDSLNLFQSVEEERIKPKTLGWISDLIEEVVLPRQAVFNLSMMGLVTRQAKISLWRHERLPLPLSYLQDEKLIQALKEALELAEQAGRLLDTKLVEIEFSDKKGKRKTWVPSPLRFLARLIVAPEVEPQKLNDNQRKEIDSLVNYLSPARSYWAALGIAFNRFMIELAEDTSEERVDSLRKWAKEIRKAAQDAFEETANNLDRTGRSLKAISMAESEFYRRLRDILKVYINDAKEGGEK